MSARAHRRQTVAASAVRGLARVSPPCSRRPGPASPGAREGDAITLVGVLLVALAVVVAHSLPGATLAGGSRGSWRRSRP